MAGANFLHGIESQEILIGPTPIRVVKSAVVGLVGTAPAGPVNTPVLCLSDKDYAQFGPELDGFTIPQALRAFKDAGAGTVIVINVCDPDEHTDDVENQAVTFHANTGLAQLPKGGISNLVLKNQAGSTTYVVDTDYEIVDAVKGVIKKKAGGAIPALVAYASFDFVDPTAVVANDIIGTTDVAGIRTGLQALKGTYTLFGFKTKIIEAPVYSTQNSVRSAMDALAQQLKAIALADAPIGTTPQQAITGRGPSGAINFNTSSHRTVLLYPHVKVKDANSDGMRLEPYSSVFAALMCWNDLQNGYWESPSNKELPGVLGLERPITAEYNDPSCEANLLNEVGIVTVMNTFGTGLRSWGNRSAAWPSDSHPMTFIAFRRTCDVVEESIELAQAKYSDKAGTKANITNVLEDVYAFIRTLVQRGAILDGKVWFDPAENPADQLALGTYCWCYDLCPPTPMERQTNKVYINLNYLTQFAQQLAT